MTPSAGRSLGASMFSGNDGFAGDDGSVPGINGRSPAGTALLPESVLGSPVGSINSPGLGRLIFGVSGSLGSSLNRLGSDKGRATGFCSANQRYQSRVVGFCRDSSR